MSKVSVNVSLNSNADLIKTASDEAIANALELVGLQAEGHAIDICPVDTGRLRNSITHAVDDHTVMIGSNVEYAPHVELGTSKQVPRPYLSPAIQNHVEEYRQIIEMMLKG